MPRHTDPRLRLVRVSHGYALLPRGVKLESGTAPYADRCTCGLPWCTWTAEKQRRAERGYKGRHGVWRTANGRFTLEWVAATGKPTGKHPDGGLRMWDQWMSRESWHHTLAEARAEMGRRYQQ